MAGGRDGGMVMEEGREGLGGEAEVSTAPVFSERKGDIGAMAGRW